MRTNSGLRTALTWTAGALGMATSAYATWVGVTWLRYGQPAAASAEDADPLLDQFMPIYEVAERHHIRVTAPADVTFAAACEQDVMALPIVKAIFKAREIVLGSDPDTVTRPRGLLAFTKSIGWGVLAEVPGREIVMGAVTQPWYANVVFRPLPPDEFVAFDEPDYVKIVWTLRAEATGPHESVPVLKRGSSRPTPLHAPSSGRTGHGSRRASYSFGGCRLVPRDAMPNDAHAWVSSPPTPREGDDVHDRSEDGALHERVRPRGRRSNVTLSGRADASAVRALIERTLLIYNGSIAFAITSMFLGAAGYATFASRVLPRWTGWLAYVGTALCALCVPAMYAGPVDPAGFYNAGGWGPAIIANSPRLIWFLVVSVWMLRRREMVATRSSRAA